MLNLKNYLSEIEGLDQESLDQALNHWDHLTHPIGSLGQLEETTIRLAGIQKRPIPKLEKKTIIVMCADSGVFEEDISSSPQEFTQMLANIMVDGRTGVCSLASYAKSDVDVVNIGMLETMDQDPRIIQKSVRVSSNNFTQEPALTEEEVLRGIQVGIEVAEERISQGYDILGTGELGIANTTTSSAVLHLMTDLSVEEAVGLGAGIDEDQFARKKRIIKEAKERYQKDPDDVIGILAAVGSLDIVGLVGVFLAGAKNRVPVVIDGLISSVAALCAARLEPKARDYMFASHLSREVASAKILDFLGLKAPVHLDMRLGEGSGCPFTFLILEAGIHCMENMGVFENTNIDHHVQVNIRDKQDD
ncbi:MAG: nicotinate-nucleotide--dimethylbenzimidazole phosphoribosyltransferase [Tissierellia bacterium]|nr:nicotinate-nucleotide--dimethylbenzimidazole phosphoribosyltransferase [Tissierellia bacterium]